MTKTKRTWKTCSKCGEAFSAHRGETVGDVCSECEQPAVAIGDMISIPTWNADGMVIDMNHAEAEARGWQYGLLLQTYPDQPTDSCRWYYLNDGNFTIES